MLSISTELIWIFSLILVPTMLSASACYRRRTATAGRHWTEAQFNSHATCSLNHSLSYSNNAKTTCKWNSNNYSLFNSYQTSNENLSLSKPKLDPIHPTVRQLLQLAWHHRHLVWCRLQVVLMTTLVDSRRTDRKMIHLDCHLQATTICSRRPDAATTLSGIQSFSRQLIDLGMQEVATTTMV